MAHATTSSSKRKGGKIGQTGGLGGPGGRGLRRKSNRPAKGGVAGELPNELLQLAPRALARAVARRAAAQDGDATTYRKAMAAITTYANRHSRTMLPEVRTKLARAKDELRVLFDMEHAGKGTGGPGKRYAKPKAQSRRNPHPRKPAKAARGGAHRAGR